MSPSDGSDYSSCRYIGSTAPPHFSHRFGVATELHAELGDVDAMHLLEHDPGGIRRLTEAARLRAAQLAHERHPAARRVGDGDTVGNEAAVDDQHAAVVLTQRVEHVAPGLTVLGTIDLDDLLVGQVRAAHL